MFFETRLGTHPAYAIRAFWFLGFAHPEEKANPRKVVRHSPLHHTSRHASGPGFEARPCCASSFVWFLPCVAPRKRESSSSSSLAIVRAGNCLR